MKEMLLTQGKMALVDDEDYARVATLTWHFSAKRYAAHRVGYHGKYIYMHRFVISASENERVDHVDGDGLNNTRINLRICTQSQNMMNARKRANVSSKYKGVLFNKSRGKYIAYIQIGGKNKHLGVFLCENDAAIAYNDAARIHFGEFARLNEVEK